MWKLIMNLVPVIDESQVDQNTAYPTNLVVVVVVVVVVVNVKQSRYRPGVAQRVPGS
jgi:hypothetical protein